MRPVEKTAMRCNHLPVSDSCAPFGVNPVCVFRELVNFHSAIASCDICTRSARGEFIADINESRFTVLPLSSTFRVGVVMRESRRTETVA
jgi:hypothetical protein